MSNKRKRPNPVPSRLPISERNRKSCLGHQMMIDRALVLSSTSQVGWKGPQQPRSHSLWKRVDQSLKL